MARTVYVAVLLAALLLFPSSSSCEEAKGADIHFVTPWPGSIIAGGPVVIAGTLPAEGGEAHFLLNGRPAAGFQRQGRSFSGQITPPRGFNEIQVRAGDKRALLAFHYGVKAGGREPYSYHKPAVEAECAACHSRAAEKNTFTEATICYGCHAARAVMFPYVHGPVAAGRCLVCHDPHGSNIPGLTRLRPEELCTRCHDQPTTEDHAASRTRVCTICHDPHYGTSKSFVKGLPGR
jgi:predicted CXXCH cytochrome family protein